MARRVGVDVRRTREWQSPSRWRWRWRQRRGPGGGEVERGRVGREGARAGLDAEVKVVRTGRDGVPRTPDRDRDRNRNRDLASVSVFGRHCPADPWDDGRPSPRRRDRGPLRALCPRPAPRRTPFPDHSLRRAPQGSLARRNSSSSKRRRRRRGGPPGGRHQLGSPRGVATFVGARLGRGRDRGGPRRRPCRDAGIDGRPESQGSQERHSTRESSLRRLPKRVGAVLTTDALLELFPIRTWHHSPQLQALRQYIDQSTLFAASSPEDAALPISIRSLVLLTLRSVAFFAPRPIFQPQAMLCRAGALDHVARDFVNECAGLQVRLTKYEEGLVSRPSPSPTRSEAKRLMVTTRSNSLLQKMEQPGPPRTATGATANLALVAVAAPVDL